MIYESDIERTLFKRARGLRGKCIKLTTEKGLPDRLLILPHCIPVFVELKRKDGTLSEMQKVQVQRLRDMGQTVYVPYSVEDVEDLIEEVMRDGRIRTT